jgi:hypothetical protein
LSDNFHIQNGLKQGDGLSPLLFNFALEYAIRKVQENQMGLKYAFVYRIFVGKPEGKRPLGRPRRRWVNNIKMDPSENEMVRIASTWLGIGTSGGFL